MKAVSKGWLALASSTLILSAAFAGCSSLSPAGALNAFISDSAYTLKADIAYGPDSQQKLDIYLPEEPASKLRTIVFVYGGAWRTGSRKDFKFVAQTLANTGHVAIIPDYRHFPTVVYPDFVTDIVDAISEVKARAPKLLGAELEELVLMGHSAGAHIAALIAADERYLTDIDITALIAIAGPYDLPLDDPEVEPVFGNVETPASVKPVELVTDAHPPTLLIHGEDDERVLPKHTRRYAEALEAKGIRVQLDMLEGTGHVRSIAAMAAPFDRSNRYQKRLSDFLDSL